MCWQFIQSGVTLHLMKPGIEQVQALADISCSSLSCHSNETHAWIANPPNTAQLEGTPTIPQVTSGSVQQCGNAASDSRQTHRRPWPIYISPRLRLTRNVTRRDRTMKSQAAYRLPWLSVSSNCRKGPTAQNGHQRAHIVSTFEAIGATALAVVGG